MVSLAFKKMKLVRPILREKIHYLTSDYKSRGNRSNHNGMDFIGKGYAADYIIAVEKGKVINAKYSLSTGYFVEIEHENGLVSRYLHMKKGSIKVSKGNVVTKGQVLGYMGKTGDATGVHLHFAIREKNNFLDPLPYLLGEKDFSRKSKISYQAYDNKLRKWLPNVFVGTNDYAGIKGHSIGGIYIDNLVYRVYDNKKKKWLPWVNGRNDYAGIKGNNIGGLQVKNATYRVHLKKGTWLAWVNGLDDYAGIKGKSIDMIQIKN